MSVTYFLRCPALLIGAGILLSGCGKAAPPVLPSTLVTGTITVDANPAIAAMVRFIPDGSTKGNGGMAITDERGQYLIESRMTNTSGLPEGKYKVVVSRFQAPEDPTLAAQFAVPPGGATNIPQTYGDAGRSPLTAIIVNGKGPYDFKLDSKKK